MWEDRMAAIGRVVQTHWTFAFLGLFATLFTIVGGALMLHGQLGGFWTTGFVLAGPMPLLVIGVATILRIRRPALASVQAVAVSPAPARPLQKMKCPFCDGSGHMRIMTGPAQPCIKCHGKGYIFTDRVGQPKCTFCWGHAYRFGATNTLCPVCDGEGLMPWD